MCKVESGSVLMPPQGDVEHCCSPHGVTAYEECSAVTCNACKTCMDVCSAPSCHECREKLLANKSKSRRTFTWCEVKRHNSSSDAWLVRGRDVYDVTSIVKLHPGGVFAIARNAGKTMDCQVDFDFHSRKAQKIWATFYIGRLEYCPGHPDRDRALCPCGDPTAA